MCTESSSSTKGDEMNKLIILILTSAILLGCGKREEVLVTIVKITKQDEGVWGCMSTRTKTILKTTDGRIDSVCGDYGNVGDEIKGIWISNHWDGARNGFKFY